MLIYGEYESLEVPAFEHGGIGGDLGAKFFAEFLFVGELHQTQRPGVSQLCIEKELMRKGKKWKT